jgi:hypothetical protein
MKRIWSPEGEWRRWRFCSVEGRRERFELRMCKITWVSMWEEVMKEVRSE